MKLDPDDSQNQAILAQVLLFRRRYDEAAFHNERALQLNPNDWLARSTYASFLLYSGQAGAALDQLNLVLKHDPYPPLWYWEIRGNALYQLGQYDEAVAAYHKMDKSQAWAHGYLAASYAMAGRMDDARREIAAHRAVELPQNYHMGAWRQSEPYRDQKMLDHLLDGLRKAGLPE
ncbi:MAG: tetratricopeptide repeat protein [Dongiaceae bacterium]